jgi:hypothetical protein
MKNLRIVPFLLMFASALCTTCPTQSNHNWQQGSIVYYSLGNISGAEATEIQQAVSNWNTANQHNNSDVTFAAADAQHPAVMTFNNGTTNPGVGASTTLNYDGGTGAMISTSTTIGINTDFV